MPKMILHINAYSYAIESSQPKMLGWWLIEQLTKWQPQSPADYVHLEIWPSWDQNNVKDWPYASSDIQVPWEGTAKERAEYIVRRMVEVIEKFDGRGEMQYISDIEQLSERMGLGNVGDGEPG